MSRLPAFEMDVTGEYSGNAYPEQHEYRIKIVTLDGTGETFLLDVQDHNGSDVGQYEFDAAVAEGLMKMASTAHSLDEYEDDWGIPVGMSRVLAWALPTDPENYVVLGEHHVDQIGDWLSFATGESTYDGPEDRWEG